jgi:hypothetical protein
MGRWSAEAPFGRVGRRLGFRWVFPVGTMAVPFHPALLPLVTAALVVWTGSRAVDLVAGAADGAGWSVLGALIGFAVVGVLLSVPVLAWFVLALGGRLVQGLLALVAMLLLAVSAASGRDPAWLLVLPMAYAGVWVAQAVGGRVVLARLRSDAERFVPVDARGRTVVLPTDVEPDTVTDLLLRCGAGAVWQRDPLSGDGGRGRVVVTAEQADRLRAAARGALPDGVRLDEAGDDTFLTVTGPVPPDALTVEVSRRADPLALLGGDVWTVSVDDRTVATGRTRVVLPVPLLNVFHWVSLTSRNEWVAGFGRGRAHPLGPGQRAVHRHVADGEPLDPATSDHALDALDRTWQEVADRDARVERLRADVLAGTVDLDAQRRALDDLRRGGAALLGPDAARVLATWLERARDGRRADEPIAVARLVAMLADEDVVRHGERLLDAFNSRRLGLRWDLGEVEDVTPLPRELQRFGRRAGFGLAADLPELYARLGDLVPAFRELVGGLADEMAAGNGAPPVPEPIRLARERWAAAAGEDDSWRAGADT